MRKCIFLLFFLCLFSCSDEQFTRPNESPETADLTTQSSSLRATLENFRQIANPTGRAASGELCFNFVYPITLGYNTGDSVEVSSYEDLLQILLDETVALHITSIAYPFEVQLSADSSIHTVNDEDDFSILVENCGYDTLEYEDVIEVVGNCFTINYPIDLVVNDNAMTFESQEGAQAYFTANYQGITSVTLAYPLSVTLVSDNSEVLVEDDYEAIDLITNICGID
ncbi:MAG: hypothetical protein CL868_10470 [Cytophagaceae bacterium]|nr:hypothetical protein [Cytophagaceae bacterium]|tara:strand:- start:20438 stop:21115 length:678 start_codon:yes stop_codon:yes gene_type:complete